MNHSPVTVQGSIDDTRQAGRNGTSSFQRTSRVNRQKLFWGTMTSILATFKLHRQASRSPGPSHPDSPLAKSPEERLESSSEDVNVSDSGMAQNDIHRDARTSESDAFKRLEGEYLQILNQKDEEIKELRAEHHRLTQHYEPIVRAQFACAEETQLLKKERAELEMNLEHLENECSRLQSVALAAQGGALQAIARGRWATMEDRAVRDELTKLQDGLRSWARKHSETTIDGELEGGPSSQKEQIIEQLKGYCLPLNWPTLLERLPVASSKALMLLVQTLLAKDIFAGIFDDPFFAFPENNQDPSLPQSTELRILYKTMLKLNPVEAHICRSQIMRVLTSPSNTPGNNGLLLLDRLQKLSSERALVFLRGPARALLHGSEDKRALQKRFEELRGLYLRAAELAITLWSQRTYMKCFGQQHLGKFHLSSPFMASHRIHHLDEDDHRLDGKRVLVTVQPAVVAFGNENAERYDQSKVWAPAVVLVEDGN